MAPGSSAAPGAPPPPLAVPPPPAAAAPASAAARLAAGKQIYRTGGEAAGPEIMAVLGSQQGAEMSATALPCAGCHGRDGKGRPEGGITPSDLTWDVLSRPYQVAGASGRAHPPYDERSLKRAITLGLDPAGQPLQAAMPRYRLTQTQADELIAYIRTLGRAADPGVAPDRLRLGVLLPPEPEAASTRRALDAAAAHLNAAGGLYGRRLDLRYLPWPPTVAAQEGRPADLLATGRATMPEPPARTAAWRAAVEGFLDVEQPLALVASAATGEEAALAALAADRELPVVGALTAAPPPPSALDREVFYLQPGLAEQARALVEAVADGLGGVARRAGLLVAAAQPESVAAAARDQFDRTGMQPWVATCEPGDRALAARIVEASQAGVDDLVFVGGAQDAHDLLAGADALDWHPRVFLLAALAAGAVLDAPPGFSGRLYLAAPSLPSDLTAAGAALLLQAGLAPPSGAAAPAAPPDDSPPGANSSPAASSPPAANSSQPADSPPAAGSPPATGGPPVVGSRPVAGSPPVAAASPASSGAASQPILPRASLYERQALAAFALLSEGLTRCGRELSRDRLIEALEGLHSFDTGLTPPLTFGPERHLGALGAYLVVFDPAQGGLAPAGGWLTPR